MHSPRQDSDPATRTAQRFDVVIVGAGISGIGAAYHLGQRDRSTSYVVLERRDRIGGTWDLFRYPGIRSDSDMYTLGYAFKPWTQAKAIEARGCPRSSATLASWRTFSMRTASTCSGRRKP